MCTNAAFLYHMVSNQAHDLLYTVEDVVALGYTTIIAAGDSSPGLELGGGNSCHFSPTHPDAIRVGAAAGLSRSTLYSNLPTTINNRLYFVGGRCCQTLDEYRLPV